MPYLLNSLIAVYSQTLNTCTVHIWHDTCDLSYRRFSPSHDEGAVVCCEGNAHGPAIKNNRNMI